MNVHCLFILFIVVSFLFVFRDEPLEQLPKSVSSIALQPHRKVCQDAERSWRSYPDLHIFAWSSELPTTKYASNNHSVSWIKAEVMSIWLSPGNKTSKSWNKNMPSFNCLEILEFFLWAKCVVVPGAWAVAISATIQPNDQISVGVAYLSFDPEHTASGH